MLTIEPARYNRYTVNTLETHNFFCKQNDTTLAQVHR